jgi:hypothetical protein
VLCALVVCFWDEDGWLYRFVVVCDCDSGVVWVFSDV